MIQVFQANSFRTACEMMDDVNKARAAFLSNEYSMVSNVDTNSLDVAFEKTNNIHCDWWENEESSKEFDADGCRSTNAGDIFLDENNQYWLVAMFGFEKIPAISMQEIINAFS